MLPTPRNIIIFVAIGALMVAAYIFFIKKSDTPAGLVAEHPGTVTSSTTTAPQNEIAQNFLSTLLNVKTIKLNDSIFEDVAFQSLHDSSITLAPDGNEGRPNPFAPLGSDSVAVPPVPISTTTSTAPVSGVLPTTVQTTTPTPTSTTSTTPTTSTSSTSGGTSTN